MPLQRKCGDGMVDPGSLAVTFPMRDAITDATVKVTVSHEALLKFGHSSSPLELFEAHRETLEQTASRKFDRRGGGAFLHVLEEDLGAR